MNEKSSKAYKKIMPLLTNPPYLEIKEICRITGYCNTMVHWVGKELQKRDVTYGYRDRWGRLITIYDGCRHREEDEQPVELTKAEPAKPMVTYEELTIGARVGVKGRFSTYRIFKVDRRMDVVGVVDEDNCNEVCNVPLLEIKPVELTDTVLMSIYGEPNTQGKWHTDSYRLQKWGIGTYAMITDDCRIAVRYLHQIDAVTTLIKQTKSNNQTIEKEK